ncbi:MAG: ComEC/Rec2 family competence protein [Candidatus Dojkabacteria bacterium]
MKLSILHKYLKSKVDDLRLFKYNFERIRLFQISLGIVLGVLLVSSSSIIVVFVILIVSFPLKRLKLVFYFCLILGSLFFINWNNSINSEVTNAVKTDYGYTATVLSMDKAEISKTLTLKIDGLQGEALADVGLYSPINVYDRVYLNGKMNLPKSFEDFDYPAYLRSNKIFYEFKGAVTLEKKDYSILSLLRDLKDKLINISETNMTIPYSSLFNGILLGDTSKIPDDIKNAFRATGTSHILSVSGFNFTIILIFLLTLAPLIGRRKLLIASIPLIVGFLLLVGINNLTALRATIMILIFIAASLLGRKVNFLYLISITLMIFLLDYPLSWTNVSLQLSFGSLLGLFFLSGSFSSFFRKLKVPESFIEPLSASIAAIVGTLPFTLNTFGTLSVVAPLVNVIVLPLVPLVMLLGFIGEVLGLLNLSELSSLLFKICEVFLKIMTSVIQYFSKLPFANTSNNIVILIVIMILLTIFIYSDFRNFYKKHY